MSGNDAGEPREALEFLAAEHRATAPAGEYSARSLLDSPSEENMRSARAMLAFARHRLSTTPASAGVLVEAADLLRQYAGFIRDDVKADDLERHPYLPAIEQCVGDLQALSTTPTPASNGVTATEVQQALRDALDHYERNICEHETTHRGGAIWTICDSCGWKWADDQGGFVPFEHPPEIKRAHDVLARLSPTPSRFGEGYRAGVEAAGKELDDRATRARVASIGGGMDPSDASLLDYEYSNAAKVIRALQPDAGGEA